MLIDYIDDECHFCYVAMKSDIASFQKFHNSLDKGKYFDLETPYGYGGPLTDNEHISDNSQKLFLSELTEYCINVGIISQFVRFHPLLANHNLVPAAIETRYMRDTIFMDTSSPELIMSNMDSKNRNMVRKAQKNGVQIAKTSINDYLDFLSMYEETMARDNADEYYTFHKDYFNQQKALENNAIIFYASIEGKPIAGSIIYFNDRFAHYHLSGSRSEYRQYAPSNLLLYEVACWASEKGIKQFHLGGGMAPDDSLFGFKKQFNKNGRLPFVVGRTIFNHEQYNKLLSLRKESDPTFDTNNNRLIQYRK